MDIAISKQVDGSFDAVVNATTEALKEVGFGVLTTIDFQAKMMEKLGKDMAPYVILGACNPPLAWEAVGAIPEIGVLLPCNVVVRQTENGVMVDAMNPLAALGLIDNEQVTKVATEATDRLKKAVASL